MSQNVSVIIPCFNASKFICRAVESVLAQNEIPLPQIIIVNDASTDDTGEVIRGLAESHPNVEAYDNSKNLGPAGSRNYALSKVTGDWVAVLDADDAYEPGRLKRLMEAAEENSLDVIADLPLMYDLAADSFSPDQLSTSENEIELLSVSHFLGHDSESGLDLGLLKPVFSRRLLTEGLLRYPESIRHAEDCALYVSLVRSGLKFGLLREAYYIFSTRIGAISGAFSPGSVTQVDYLSIAQQARNMKTEFSAAGELDRELEGLLDAREARALLANRRYGWSVLRMREFGRLYNWLRQNPGNLISLLRVLVAKLLGHRGLPD